MTKQNKTTGIEQANAQDSTECLSEHNNEKRLKNDALQRAVVNAESAFKEQGKVAKTLTKTALELVVAYFNAKNSVELDKDTRADLRARWSKYNDSKFESGVFYRVAKTCANNAKIVVECIDHAEKDAVQVIRDRFLAIGISLTSCKSAAESAAARATVKSARAAVESAAAVERRAAEAENAARAAEKDAEKARAAAVKAESDAAARVKAAEKRAAAAEKVAAGALNSAAVVAYVAECSAAAFAAICAAVDKRRAAEKAAARESAIDGVIRDAAKKGKTLSRVDAAKLWDNRTIESATA